MSQEHNDPQAEPQAQPPQTAPGSEASSTAGETNTAEQARADASGEAPRRHRGAPLWLLAIAAIVPAAIVGVVVYFAFSSGGGGDNKAAGIVDGLIRLGPSEASTVSSYKGELPPQFTSEFPMYGGAEVVVSIAIASEQGTSYFIVMSTDDPADDVFAYYSEALDADPWQVEVGRASEEFTGLRFLRPDNIDISGDITLHQSELDDQTAIYLSFDDISQTVAPGEEDDAFALGETRPLPPGFPEDMPIYSGEEDSVVLDTYFERGQGGQAFVVSFLTRDTQDQVIEFYKSEFESRGWNVTDAGALNTDFALSIEFNDADAQSLSGSITANSFDADPAYTQVDLLVTVSGARGN